MGIEVMTPQFPAVWLWNRKVPILGNERANVHVLCWMRFVRRAAKRHSCVRGKQ
jgi:hypothetical protein